MQVRRFGKAVVQGDCQGIAQTDAPDWRYVLAIVEHALELMAIDRVRARCGNQIDIQPSVPTGEHRRIRKHGILALCLLRSAPRHTRYQDDKSDEGRTSDSRHLSSSS